MTSNREAQASRKLRVSLQGMEEGVAGPGRGEF